MARRIAIGVLFVLGFAGGAAGQESWSDHTAAGEWAFSRGELDRCEAEFRAALEAAQALPAGGPPARDQPRATWRVFTSTRPDGTKLSRSTSCCWRPRRCASVRTTRPCSTPCSRWPEAAYRSATRRRQRPSLTRYLAIADVSGSDDPAARWQAASLLARVLSLQDRREEALEFQRSAMSALADDGFASDLDRAAQLETLAQLEITDGSADAVEALLDEVVELRVVAEEESGAVEVYGSAASAALGAGELELAERLASKAIAAGDGGPDTLTACRVLADVSWLKIRRSGELADVLAVEAEPEETTQAIDRLRSLLELQDGAGDPSHPDRVETLSRLAQTTAMAGDLEAAARWQRLYAEAVADGGGDRPWVALDGLAYLLTEAGLTDEALQVNSDLLQRLEKAWGADDPRLIPVLHRQQLLLAEVGRKKEAKAIRKRLGKLGG